jgi:hypothetical protein
MTGYDPNTAVVAWGRRGKDDRKQNEYWPRRSLPQSTYILYVEYHCVCPLGIGTIPLIRAIPSPASECAPPPPGPKGGGTLVCGWVHGGVQIRTIGEKALCPICGPFNNLLIYLLLWRVYKPRVSTSGFLMLMLVSGGEEATHRKWYYQHRLCWRGPRGDG